MAAQDESEDPSTSDAPVRPPLSSHQSNSLPSTPYQLARDGPFEARTPPREPPSSKPQSPRSVSGDSKRMARNTNPAINQACRFMFTQVSRRRMPYSDEAGGAPILPTPKREPKTALDEAENARLSNQVSDLYQHLLPSQDNQTRRELMLRKLREIISQTWPGKDFQVQMFGSSGNLLFHDKSDVDICVTMPNLTTCALAELLNRRGMRDVKCVHAKIRIVKIWDPELQLNSDLNVNNELALTNTQMVKTYIKLDPRVRPLAMIVKLWTRKRIINEASGGTLSSYTWTLLLINYLQTRSPPVLPQLSLVDSDGQRRSDFSADLETYHDFGSPNKESLGELLFYFFRRHAYEIDFETAVVSVRKACLLSKKEKGWHLATNNRLCVEEPFSTDRNLANTADDSAWRGLHLELRRAFDLLAEGNSLTEDVCHPYEFLEQTKPTIDRVQPASRPVILTRSLSQSGRSSRGGSSLRGNRQYHGRDVHSTSGPNSRRASSAAAFGHTSVPMFANTQLGVPLEFLRAQPQNPMQQPQPASGIHNHLAQVHSSLRAREQELRQQAANLAQVSAESERAASGSSFGAQSRVASLGALSARSSGNSSTTAAPLPSTIGYPYVRWDGTRWVFQYPPAQPVSHPNASTNASSPLMTPTPGRRELHRDQYSTSAGATIRSQSQPARPAAPTSTTSSTSRPRHSMMMPPSAPHDNRLPYQMMQPVPQHGWVGPFLTSNGWALAPASTVQSGPREYLGYGLANSHMQPQYHDTPLGRTATYDDLRLQGRQTPTNDPHPRFAASVPEVSRTPSPLNGVNGQYETLGSASMSTEAPGFNGHTTNNSRSIDKSSPLIVNGSYVPEPLPLARNDSSDGGSRCLSESDQNPPTNLENWQHPDSSFPVGQLLPPAIASSAKYTDADSDFSEYDYGNSELHNRKCEPNGNNSASGYLAADEPQTGVAAPGIWSSTTPADLSGETDDHRVPVSTQSANSSTDVKPPSLQPSALGIGLPTPQNSNRKPSSSKGTVSPLDLGVGMSEGVQNSAKLLSPVQETTTPSPTSSRKRHSKGMSEDSNLVNGSGHSAGLNGDTRPNLLPLTQRQQQIWPTQETAPRVNEMHSNNINSFSTSTSGPSTETKEQSIISQKSPIASSSTRTPIISSSSTNTNPWQQAGGKKATRKAKSTSGSFAQGQPEGNSSGGQPMPANASERKGG